MPKNLNGPLQGLRVLDLSTRITGPYATKLFADAGADVVKLESPAGDPLRRWRASDEALPPGETGALFQYLNGGKRSVVADLGTEAGRDFALDLAARSDLVVESLGAGVADRLGVGWSAVQERNARCSLVSISPWGGDGPWAERASTEFTLQAATGSIAYRGHPSLGPVGSGGRIGEWIPGAYAAIGGLAAWRSARQTGAGQHVDLSVFEVLCLAMTVYHDLNSQFFEGPLPQAIETPSIEPCKDGWVTLCTITGQQWKDFCALIGQAELSEDEKFYDAKARMEQLDFIHGVIHAYTKAHTVDEIIETMSLARIPISPLGNGRTLLEMDHLKERGVFLDAPGGGKQPRPPYRLSGGLSEVESSQHPVARPAPALGADTEDVLRELATPRHAPAAPEGGEALPYAGLRVLDLCAFWAGPVAGSFLGELGADVVKVESIQRPDFMRFAGSVRNDTMWEWNPIHHGCNANKRDITLHVDSEEGKALLWRLVETADVVIENFSPRVLENWGLDWQAVHTKNPKAILVRMPSFGLDGPWRDRVGFAMNIEGASGLAWLTGYDHIPLVVRGACDPVGGMHAVFALDLALEERRRTGRGQLVETPLLEPAINLAAEQVIEWSAYGHFLERTQNRSPLAAPQGVYPCGDEAETGDGPGYVAIAVETDAQWEALRGVLGDPEWARDPALATRAGRRAAHDAIDARLSAWTGARTRKEAADALLAAGVPANECINPHSLFPNPQLEHRGFFQEMEHPAAGKVRYPGQPMIFSGLPRHLRTRPAPMLGEHNEEILKGELGLSDEELETLREKKVIGTRPAFF